MKLLLDESLPKRLRTLLPNHEVSTVALEGWGGIKNGQLLQLAATRFDAFITADKNLGYQQNLKALALAVVVLEAHSNKLAAYVPLIENLELALKSLEPRSFVTVMQS